MAVGNAKALRRTGADPERRLRFRNPDVLTNLNGVLETILAAAQGDLPEG